MDQFAKFKHANISNFTVYTYIRTYIEIYIPIYIHTYIRTYIHTYIQKYHTIPYHTYIWVFLKIPNDLVFRFDHADSFGLEQFDQYVPLISWLKVNNDTVFKASVLAFDRYLPSLGHRYVESGKSAFAM